MHRFIHLRQKTFNIKIAKLHFFFVIVNHYFKNTFQQSQNVSVFCVILQPDFKTNYKCNRLKMKDNRDSIDFGKADIRKLFRTFFFPTMMGMLFNMAFIVTDGIFVGHGIGPHGLAAVNLIAPIMMLINGLAMMFGIGASVVAAIHLSHNNIKAARINSTQAYLAGCTIAIVMGIVCYGFPNEVLTLLGAQGELYDAAYEYYIWFIPTCLLMTIETIGLFVIRLDGSPRYAMIANIIPAIINIFLDYLFIFPLGMGLKGASLATDIGGFAAVVMVAIYMFFFAKTLKPYMLKRTRKSMMLTIRNVGYMIRMGFSGLLGELAVSVMIVAGNLIFKHYLGKDGVSAFSIACYLFPLFYMIYNAVAQSAQPIISYNHGAGKIQRVQKTLAFGISISVGIGAVMTLVFIFFAPLITSIFINSSEPVYEIAASGLPYWATNFIFMAFNICMIGYYQSVEASMSATFFTLLRGIVFMVAAFVILPILIDEKGLWLAIPLAELLTTLSIIIYELWKIKNHSKEHKIINTMK